MFSIHTEKGRTMVPEMQLEVREIHRPVVGWFMKVHHLVLDGCLTRDEAAQNKRG